MILIDKDQFKTRIDRIDGMPTLPRLMQKLSTMVNDPNFSIEDIAEEIGRDQILAAKILKLVNSAFYGFPGRISSLTHALVLLGFDVLKALIFSTQVFDFMRESMMNLWLHSLAVSRAAGFLASELKEPDPEEVTLAGLLHDIGKVILKLKVQDQYEVVVQAAEKKGVSTLAAERRLMGFDHADVAYWLCEKWTLPEKLAIPMGYHHKIRVPRTLKRATAIVALADVYAKAAGFGTEGDKPIRYYDPIVLEILELTIDQATQYFETLIPEFPLIADELGEFD